jgi:hypothetical protein
MPGYLRVYRVGERGFYVRESILASFFFKKMHFSITARFILSQTRYAEPIFQHCTTQPTKAAPWGIQKKGSAWEPWITFYSCIVLLGI